MEHNFVLYYRLASDVTEEMLEKFYGKVEDGDVSSHGGEIRIEFCREAPTPVDATRSAIDDLRSLWPDALLVRVELIP